MTMPLPFWEAPFYATPLLRLRTVCTFLVANAAGLVSFDGDNRRVDQ